MIYDMQRGILATQAVAELLRAEPGQNREHYEAFLRKASDFCKSIRESAALVVPDVPVSGDAQEFLSAVVKSEKSRARPISEPLESELGAVEKLVADILSQRRIPSLDEQLRIAEVLYLASAVDIAES